MMPFTKRYYIVKWPMQAILNFVRTALLGAVLTVDAPPMS